AVITGQLLHADPRMRVDGDLADLHGQARVAGLDPVEVGLRLGATGATLPDEGFKSQRPLDLPPGRRRVAKTDEKLTTRIDRRQRHLLTGTRREVVQTLASLDVLRDVEGPDMHAGTLRL